MVKNPIDIISLQVEERSSIGISDETIDKTNQSNKRTIIAMRNQKVYFHFYKWHIKSMPLMSQRS